MKRKASVFDNAQISSLMENIKNRQTVVNITDLQYNEHRVVVMPTETIAEIKAKLTLRHHPIVPHHAFVLIKDDGMYALEESAMVKHCNLVDGDKLELWSLECYAIMLKSRLSTRSAMRRMEAYLETHMGMD